VIDACQQMLHWAARGICVTRWCEQQPEMVAFTATCLVHRAEVMQVRGAWEEAMTEACHAHERVLQAGERKPPAAAFYRQANPPPAGKNGAAGGCIEMQPPSSATTRTCAAVDGAGRTCC
jgi:hypothetical protein